MLSRTVDDLHYYIFDFDIKQILWKAVSVPLQKRWMWRIYMMMMMIYDMMSLYCCRDIS